MQKDSSNTRKNFNYLLFLFTLIAGVAWWGLGEAFFSFLKDHTENIIKNPLLNGIYFAFLLLLTILACLFSEKKIHSIVKKDFYEDVVFTPSLKIILPVAFGTMLLTAGIMEFIYEFEYTPSIPKQVINQNEPVKLVPAHKVIPIDYYFLLDNTTSLEWNDPDKERIKLLEKIVNNFSEDKKIALISFADKPTIHIRPEYATDQVKRQFVSTIRNLRMIDYTNLRRALISASSILVNDYSRKEVIIFITDGEDDSFDEYSSDFNLVLNPFITANVPIHSVFLNTENIESSFLKNVSSLTDGVYTTIDNPLDLESHITQVISDEEENVKINIPSIRPGRVSIQEPSRDLLDVRTGRRQNSILHGIIRILFITIIGLLMGYLLSIVFSSRRAFFLLLIGGGISGFLTGLILEICFQTYILPSFIIRLFLCIGLSTITWFVSFVSHFTAKDEQYNDEQNNDKKHIDNHILEGKVNKKNYVEGKLGK
jgi:hypothetical protein